MEIVALIVLAIVVGAVLLVRAPSHGRDANDDPIVTDRGAGRD